MKSIRTLLSQRPTATLLTLAVVFAGWQCPARAQEFMPDATQKTQQTPTGRIVWHHVGRVFLNPNTGGFVYVGYLVHIDPVDGSLFNGSPSESAAYFTFSTDLGSSRRCPTITMHFWILCQPVHSASTTTPLPAPTGATRPAS